MAIKNQRPSRRSIRLPAYNYGQPGAYFVTICVQHRQPLFGEIREGEMRPNRLGAVITEILEGLQAGFDQWVLMPNHLHAILINEDDPKGRFANRPYKSKDTEACGRRIQDRFNQAN